MKKDSRPKNFFIQISRRFEGTVREQHVFINHYRSYMGSVRAANYWLFEFERRKFEVKIYHFTQLVGHKPYDKHQIQDLRNSWGSPLLSYSDYPQSFGTKENVANLRVAKSGQKESVQ